jgi:beta-lactam-binding protein with PASTA domain
MIRFFRLLAQILVLVIIALASTLISMRFAIHGREVKVPDFRGMAPAEAERVAFDHGLEFSRSDRFYSATVPAGRIVSQQPDPGTSVRRGWRVQAAESLGIQRIEIPAVTGMSPRAAEINLLRRGLELGNSAELPTSASAPQTILAQTPAPGAQGVASPRVSLLYAVQQPDTAYAMPDLTGMPLSQATALVTQSGLKTVSVTSTPAPLAAQPSTPQPSAPASARPSFPSHFTGFASPAIPSPRPLANPTNATVVGQTPAPGSRVTPGTTVSLEVTHS